MANIKNKLNDSVLCKIIYYRQQIGNKRAQPLSQNTYIFEKHALRVFKSFRHKAIHSKNGRVNCRRHTEPISKRLNLVYFG